MDLNTVTEVAHPSQRGHFGGWQTGDAWLAGGTWLFSEPQPDVRRLVDLAGLRWPAIELREDCISIAATCRLAELHALTGAADWAALPLVSQCCNALLASFKIWNEATIGGNICMSLPAGAMISLAVALDGICVIWGPDGDERLLPVEQFVTGVHENVLRSGDLLRAIELPVRALRRKTSFRQSSLTHLGRSAALLIGTLDPADKSFVLTVTAATIRPSKLSFPSLPSDEVLRARITDEIPDSLYLNDVHGEPRYRKHLTHLFAEQIRQELSEGAAQ